MQAERIPYPQNTTGKLMERIVARKIAHDSQRGNVLPQNQGGYRTEITSWESAARFAFNVCEGFQRRERTLAMAVDLEDEYYKVQFKILIEPIMLDAHKMAHSSTPGKKDCHATWKLDLHAPTTDKGTSTGSRSLSPVFYNVYTNGQMDQWFKPGAYACRRRAYLQNSQ